MEKIKQIALIGNPNVGKTTLFNQLTGLNQKVANWPGVTLNKVSGSLKTPQQAFEIVDFPGLYSLEHGEVEEQVVIDDLKQTKYDCIISVIDATQLERHLPLVIQLARLHTPMIIALNFYELALKRDIAINTEVLSSLIGAPVIIINPRKQAGTSALLKRLDSFEQLTTPHSPLTFPNDHATLIQYINTNVIPAVVNGTCNRTELTLTNRIDRIVLNKWLAFPILLFILFALFSLTFQFLGQPLADFIDAFISDTLVPWLESLTWMQENPILSSLFIEGIIGGVGTVITALPLILALFLGTSIIEDSGYMSRISVILDRLLRKIGLSGRAIVPLISGFGCTVPALMATKGLASDRERKMATLLVPFMSCSARLPIYALFAVIFFPGYELFAIAGLYFFGVFIAIIIGLLLKKFVYKEEPIPFVMELPEYRIPAFISIFKHTYNKALGFLKKATTTILAGVILIWAASHFTFQFAYTDAMEESMLANLGNILAPLFQPLGFGTWQNVVGIISGFLAKETVVSTFGVVYGDGGNGDPSAMISTLFTHRSAISFLVFTLLYTPCIAVIGTVKTEYGRLWAAIIAIYPVIIAWIVSFIVYLSLGIFGF